MTTPILRLENLRTHFPIYDAFGRRRGWLRALDGVSLAVRPQEILGVVGESGCGKSTLGKTVVGIQPATSGTIEFEGGNVTGLSRRAGRILRSRLQYCYQDPGASLDPRWTIGASLEEPLVIHTQMPRSERQLRIREILDAVGLPERHLVLYPHEISGGQQRRVGLARILMLRPSLVVLDEPTSGLDVSVQATVLRLFLELQERFALSYIFISHDLSVVRLFSHRIAVMYLGKVVEIGETERIFAAPSHPYTQSLLAALPIIGSRRVIDTFSLQGEPPSPSRIPAGCSFSPRCAHATELRRTEVPPPRPLHDGRAVACHFAEQIAASLGCSGSAPFSSRQGSSP